MPGILNCRMTREQLLARYGFGLPAAGRKRSVTKNETARETERSIATGESSASPSTLEQLCIIGVAAGP